MKSRDFFVLQGDSIHRRRGVRKRSEVKELKALSREKVELYLIWLSFFVNHLYLYLTILNYNLLCGFLARTTHCARPAAIGG